MKPARTGTQGLRPSTGGRLLPRLFLLAAAFFLGLSPLAGAQQPTLLEMLFGRRPTAPQWREAPPQEPVKRPARPRSQQPRPAARPVTAETEVEKNEDARTVLVAGDFLALGLGDGLKDAFATAPGIVIAGRANVSSGLVREDFYNWQQELPALLDAVKPAAVILVLGANDRQQMDDGGATRKFGTDDWFAEYGHRAAALAHMVRARSIPLLWVGLPPFQSSAMTADAVTLNRILRAETEKAGGTFIDIWDGFADEAGKFVTTGSDINGQPARLRATDGIGLSKAGKRKLAFYLEKPVKDLLGDAAAQVVPGELRLETETLPDLLSVSPEEADGPKTTIPVAVTDPGIDGGDTLLGAGKPATAAGETPRRLLLERGELPAAPPGRADHVTLGR